MPIGTLEGGGQLKMDIHRQGESGQKQTSWDKVKYPKISYMKGPLWWEEKRGTENGLARTQEHSPVNPSPVDHALSGGWQCYLSFSFNGQPAPLKEHSFPTFPERAYCPQSSTKVKGVEIVAILGRI